MAHDDGSPVRLSEYCSLLVGNRRFRYMFSSYLLTNTGKWVNYIASLALIHQLVDQPDAAASTHSTRPACQTHTGWGCMDTEIHGQDTLPVPMAIATATNGI